MLVLIVEDDVAFNEALCNSLKKWGHKAFSAHNVEEALRLIEENQFDLVFSDLALPKINGKQILDTFRKQNKDTPFYIITGFNDKLNESDLDPNTRILNKPFRLKEFKSILEEADK